MMLISHFADGGKERIGMREREREGVKRHGFLDFIKCIVWDDTATLNDFGSRGCRTNSNS